MAKPGAQVGSTRYGWDGPLRLKILLNQREFIKSMAQAAPVGTHPHDQLSNSHYTDKRVKYPRQGMRLKAAMGDRGVGKWNIFYNKEGSFIRASIAVMLPYARIIDQGGEIPAVWPVAGLRYTKGGKARYRTRLMHFNAGDGDKFSMYRKGYTIKGQDYVSKGFNDYCNKTGSGGGMKVGWIEGTNKSYGGIS